jgi:hypothetical protein
VDRQVRIGGHLRVEQRLEPTGSIPLALPAQDGGADLGPPRVHLLSDGGVDLTQKIGKLVLVGIRALGGTAAETAGSGSLGALTIAGSAYPLVPPSRRTPVPPMSSRASAGDIGALPTAW